MNLKSKIHKRVLPVRIQQISCLFPLLPPHPLFPTPSPYPIPQVYADSKYWFPVHAVLFFPWSIRDKYTLHRSSSGGLIGRISREGIEFQAMTSLRDIAHDGVLCTFIKRSAPDRGKLCGPSGQSAWAVHHVQNDKITPFGSLSSSQPGGPPCWASPLYPLASLVVTSHFRRWQNYGDTSLDGGV